MIEKFHRGLEPTVAIVQNFNPDSVTTVHNTLIRIRGNLKQTLN